MARCEVTGIGVRKLLLAAAIASAVTAGALAAGPAAAASTVSTASTLSAPAVHKMFVTFYGWWDNTPPGGAIAFPHLHQTAGGTGTFADPITFASFKGELPPGTKVYVPRIGRYFIMEDSCQECQADWSGHGPDGGPRLYHIDLWLGGKGGDPMAAINCEGALTNANSDGTPLTEPVIVDPPSNLTVDPQPVFNVRNGRCYQNAQLPVTVGTYKNRANGQCLADPGDSSTPGVRLRTQPCTGSPPQRFTFQGAFLIKNGLCADFATRQISLRSCTAGPTQQWSVNPNGTITDIQTGQFCIATSGTKVIARACNGSAARWTFASTIPVQPDFSVAISPGAARGKHVTIRVRTAVTVGTAEHLQLFVSGLPVGGTGSFARARLQAGGSTTLTIAIPAATRPGTYLVAVTASGPTGTHTVTLVLREPAG